ncbi:efflux RND transporter periplasmic adaptor subunit [Halomonas ramblicola]|uniref:efflux RND transporter periplasmic adaptor subunit n=1 Tax=Halomonas ramblicola TaxID=747349 RepID=UPI0025B567AC|nr:efflux RND transporter periplasmic adaptor subunit [Halomonas ramblicola]MDN3521954.1 efflux RND transporter periplasmic adaptor subunit [Halomonas ramblicola]
MSLIGCRSSRRPVAPLALLLVALGLVAGCTPEETPPEERPRVVATHLVQPADGPTLTRLSGRVRAARRTTLSLEVGGELASLTEVGEAFAAGDALATLDDERYRLTRERRRAEVREAEAVLREKRQDHDRLRDLAARDFASRAQLDAARAAQESAEARLATARAVLALAERDLAQARLRAPFRGTVGRRHAEPGERVEAGQPLLEVVADGAGFEVRTSVPETLVGELRPGSRHRVTLPALGGETLTATLAHLGPQPASSNDYPLILRLEAPPPGVREGMTAEVTLATPAAGGAGDPGVRVPTTALVHGEAGPHVLRLDADDHLERVAVTVVALGDGLTAVRGALRPGERVVARGAEFVTAGERVTPLETGPERYH